MTQITIAISLTLRVGSLAEQTFNAVERVEEYCHLPEEAAYELTKKASTNARRGPAGSGSGGSAGGGAAATTTTARKPRSKAVGDGLREPLLPVTNADSAGSNGNAAAAAAGGAAGGSRASGPLVVVDGAVPEGWPREGSIEFSEVKMR